MKSKKLTKQETKKLVSLFFSAGKVLSDSQQEILDETKEIEKHKTKNVLSESLQEILIG